MTQEQFLMNEGWVLSQRKKQGCMWIVRWSLPGTEWQRVNQGTAYRVARDSKKWREQHKPEEPPHAE